LKYVWFQETAIDQHIQYGLANHVYNEGYIATQGRFGVSVYCNTPFIHLTFAIFSIDLNRARASFNIQRLRQSVGQGI
jgi:hypothetical protein